MFVIFSVTHNNYHFVSLVRGQGSVQKGSIIDT